MKKILFVLLYIISSYASYSQEFKTGLIMPNNEFKICCMYIPSSGLKIYDKPNGDIQGKIHLGKADSNNEFYTAFIEKNGDETALESSNLEMVGYETMAVVFVDSVNGFVMLNNGCWISVEEVTSKNLNLISWMNYAIKKNSEWYADAIGLNLREGPSTDFKKIATLKGDLFGITLTTEKKGKWSKVNVKEYRKHPCSGEDNVLIETYTGWIKLISEQETLNVWTYQKGC
ncbi:SH3 domain-containing protein [Maribacter sp. BPC-D8]|uniref:SH3 domain-containing protein n=1 Tax=Maribacter sp. BPC-D8 TaxID=3053613 RepID=UPI002B4A2D8C|nr:SH3 domain-containing protein [Maribacter sp. BPC-D8]WRI30941.1 SH3 domain-containing protein [Maribacter sp. BPC-D8]